MTEPLGGSTGGAAGVMSAPQLAAMVTGGADGPHGVLHDVLRAGLDPVGAFGAAAALHRVVGSDAGQQMLGGRPSVRAGAVPVPSPNAEIPHLDDLFGPPRTGGFENLDDLFGPAGERAAESGPAAGRVGEDVAGARVRESGAAAVRSARAKMADAFAERGVKRAVAQGAVTAASRGGMLGLRALAATALRVGTLSVPVLGTAISVVLWMIDTDGRRAFNNLIASLSGSAAPELDAPPEPPRTVFLPLTHDGNRDNVIEAKDQAMAHTNDAAFRFHPDDVWPSAPAIETTTDFADVANKINAFNGKLTRLVESVTTIYGSSNEQYVAQCWANTKPGVDALGDFQSTMLPTIGAQLMAGATSANNAYQAFRAVNLKNRQEISNSTSGMIPFRANHVDETHMSDSTGELKAAVDDMARIAQTLAGAADTFAVKPNRAGDPAAGAPTPPQDQATPAPPPVAPLTPPAAAPESAPTPRSPATPTPDLASLLRGAGAGMPMGAMPMGAGGMPSMGGLPSGMNPLSGPTPSPAAKPAADKPTLDDATLRKALDDRLKERDDAKKAPGDDAGPAEHTPPSTPPVAAGPVVKAVPAGHGEPGPQGAPPAPPVSNATEIGGRKWTFDNPKLAQLAHGLTGTDGAAHKSIYQSASEAGFTMPPPGQDIGHNVPVNQLKPGDVVMGANNHNGVFLGVVDNQAMAINEAGKVVPLSDIAQFDGPHQGFFRLADGGAPPAAAPPPSTQPVADTAATPPPAPAAIPPAAPLPPTTAATDPGVMPGQNTGAQELNPRTVPPNN